MVPRATLLSGDARERKTSPSVSRLGKKNTDGGSAKLKAYFEPPIKIAKWVHFAARTVLVVAASTHRPGAAKVTLACCR